MKKHITGVLISNVPSLINLGPKTYDKLDAAKAAGHINEVMLIPLPFALVNDEMQYFDEQTRFNYAYAKSYVDRNKQFNIWHGPESATTNEDFINGALASLRKQYDHQVQVILSAPNVTPEIEQSITIEDYLFEIVAI